MPETLRGVATGRLERSCGRRPDSIRFTACLPGLERAEVHLSGRPFVPHRHDTYAVGVTTAGVQTFHYRGERHICLPGELHVLHPDELHDGAAATDDGFSYRIWYLAPELVAEALGGGPLPFVATPVHGPGPLTAPLISLLTGTGSPIGELARVEVIGAIADGLRLLAGDHPGVERLDRLAVERARDYLGAHASEQTPASVLEQIAGADRYTIARDFRRAFGTSPDRYRTMRRLALARHAIANGRPLALAAAEAGFADQSHLTRQFKGAYGLTPGRFARAVAAGSAGRLFENAPAR
jgi:AraC-like DNA-binding protein